MSPDIGMNADVAQAQMDTKHFFILASVALGLAAFLALSGFLLAVFGPIDHKNSKRYTAIAASLAAAIVMWLIQRAHLVMGDSIFDIGSLLLILWFVCLFLFWMGVVQGIKLTSHHKDFGDSSILSMQYMESRMIDERQTNDATNADFQETELHGAGNPLLPTKKTKPKNQP